MLPLVNRPLSRPVVGRSSRLQVRAQAASSVDKPRWTGEDEKVSKMVDALINFEPLYRIMKFFARRTIISTAEKNGIPWRDTARSFDNPEVYAEFKRLEDKSIQYPDYYQVPFHAYDEGNLSWQAAQEAVPATMSMAIRVWPTEKLTPEAAQERLRGTYARQIKEYIAAHGNREPRDMLDLGCSVGVSTDALVTYFPEAQVSGLDLSPHFLAVASYRDKKREGGPKVKAWHHLVAERSGLPSASYDVIAIQFVFHECPESAIRDILREVKRLLRPGGVVTMCDNNPKSKVIQNLPPAIFTLMKSTEPHSNSYYSTEIEDIMREVGFGDVATVELDPRHRHILATAPRA